jgi:hypothetical protein
MSLIPLSVTFKELHNAVMLNMHDQYAQPSRNLRTSTTSVTFASPSRHLCNNTQCHTIFPTGGRIQTSCPLKPEARSPKPEA